MKYIYQLRAYFNTLPPAGRLFYILLSLMLDLVLVMLIVNLLGGSHQWEQIGILTVLLVYTVCLEKIWEFVEGVSS